MLYDPKWNKLPKFFGRLSAPLPPEVRLAPPVRSLAGLIAWLEKQDPSTRYAYVDSSDCLAARYLRAMGEQRYVLPSLTTAAARAPA